MAGVQVLEDRCLLSGGAMVDPLAAEVGTAEIGPAQVANVQVTDDPDVQQMPSVAVDPLNPDHVVVAYMDYSLVHTGYAGIGVAVSRDGGETWTQTSIPLPDDFDEGVANPVVVFDGQGRIFVSFMAVTYLADHPPLTNPDFFARGAGNQSNNGIFVARSDDDGLTWNEPAAVVSHLHTGAGVDFEVIPDLAIDTFPTLPDGEPNPHYGNLYAVWTRLYAPGNFPGEPDASGGGDIMIAVSEDGGATWQERFQEEDGVRYSVFEFPLNFGLGVPPGLTVVDQAHVAVGPEGDVYVSSTWGGRFAVHHSTDAGRTFVPPDEDPESGLAFGDFANLIPQADGLPNNRFRTFPSRAIAANPLLPGQSYAAEAIQNQDPQGNLVDGADVFFARSGDFGQNWDSRLTVAGVTAEVVNDDNDGQVATGLSPQEVITGQALPQLAIDERGNIALVWYDTRRDPADHLLDVFGTFSTDAGQTFRPNFRITDVSFDADAGSFINAAGEADFFLGDFIGLAASESSAYIAWTDTRTGNQDIFFARSTFDPAPDAFNDRFEPNDSFQTATQVGRFVQRSLPKLAVEPGDEDWFSVEAAASGDLVVSVTSESGGGAVESLVLELWDSTGTNLLVGESTLIGDSGAPTGRELRFATASGEQFLIRVRTTDGNTTAFPLTYALGLQSLTADLGPQVFVSLDGNVSAGGAALYRLEAAASGSFGVELVAGSDVQGKLAFQVLDPQDFSVLAPGAPPPGLALVADDAEPNDAIGQANETGLAGVGSVIIEGFIGDGEFGSTSGDFDYYSLDVGANHEITIDVDAATLGSGLDSLVILYDSAGTFLAFNDDAGGLDSFLTFTTERADTYFVAVMDAFSAAIAPFTPGGGTGAETTGEYRVTIATQLVGPGSINRADLPVKQGQEMLVLVSGVAGSGGDFTLELTNRDQFTAQENRVLFFPLGTGPSSVAVEDVDGDGIRDLIAGGALTDVVSVFLGNGDGTFQSPREFGVGAFTIVDDELPLLGRRLVVGDFSGDGFADVAVTNAASSDISVLLGRGDGTFETGRRFDARESPAAVDAGDLDGDGTLDLVVADLRVATVLGRGDGTFLPQQSIETPERVVGTVPGLRLVDLDKDGLLDLAFSGASVDGIDIFLGTSDGGFTLLGQFDAEREAPDVDAADLDGDGILDLVVASFDESNVVSVLFGNGDGTFQEPALNVPAGQAIVAAEIVDFASRVVRSDGSIALGPPDGRLDIVVAASGLARAVRVTGGPEVVILPGLSAEDSSFAGFGDPQQLAVADRPIGLDTGDLNNDGVPDVVAVDRDGLLAIFAQPPEIAANSTRETARDLGIVVHLLEPTQTIVPGREDAWFRLHVPTEALAEAGDEVLDISALFEHEVGAGLQMDVLDAAGNRLGSGDRLRITAAQGEELFVHIFGVEDTAGNRGAGAFTLDMNVLPQVISVEAESLLPGEAGRPGGPVTNLIIAFQGDRLDRATAEDPSNYTVTFLGPDGQFGTADDRRVSVGGPGIEQKIVYNPSANVDISSGRTFPTAVKQTVTLLFAEPLAPGSYRIELAPEIQTERFNEDELQWLAEADSFNGHPVVSVAAGQIREGSIIQESGLVLDVGPLGDLGVFEQGTRFLTQLQSDLGSFLDALLTRLSDDPSVPASVLQQMFDRIVPGLGGLGERATQLLVIFLDPVDVDFAAPSGNRLVYNLQSGAVTNTVPKTYGEFGGNAEVIVVADAVGTYNLNIANVPARARGGAILLGQNFNEVLNFTPEIRSGRRSFSLTLEAPLFPGSTAPPVNSNAPVFTIYTGTSNGTGVGRTVDLLAGFGRNSGNTALIDRLFSPTTVSTPFDTSAAGAVSDGTRDSLLAADSRREDEAARVMRQFRDVMRRLLFGSVSPHGTAIPETENPGGEDWMIDLFWFNLGRSLMGIPGPMPQWDDVFLNLWPRTEPHRPPTSQPNQPETPPPEPTDASGNGAPAKENERLPESVPQPSSTGPPLKTPAQPSENRSPVHNPASAATTETGQSVIDGTRDTQDSTLSISEAKR